MYYLLFGLLRQDLAFGRSRLTEFSRDGLPELNLMDTGYRPVDIQSPSCSNSRGSGRALPLWCSHDIAL
jgi:hypothetical protein